MSKDWHLAIDFGTTTTVAAYCEIGARGEASLVRFGDSYRLSSAVLSTDGRLDCGPGIEGEAELFPERVERCPKRHLGEGGLLLDGAWHRDVDLAAALLDRARREAMRLHSGEAPASVALTCPARWEAYRRQALLEAAAAAGIRDPILVSEPIAAANALAGRAPLGLVEQGSRVVVFDFGGGTLDIAVVRLEAEGFVVDGPVGGDEHLGGEDIDDALLKYVAGQLPTAEVEALFDPDGSEEPDVWRRAGVQFAAQARRAKEGLSERPKQLIRLPAPPMSIDYVDLTEATLAAVAGSIITTALNRLDGVLQQADLAPDDIAAIYLVGGASKLPLVARRMGTRFKAPIVPWGDPKALVALGAAEMHRARAVATGSAGADRDPLTPDARSESTKVAFNGDRTVEPSPVGSNGGPNATRPGSGRHADEVRDRGRVPASGPPRSSTPNVPAGPGPRRINPEDVVTLRQVFGTKADGMGSLHLLEWLVRPGQQVNLGDRIAVVGESRLKRGKPITHSVSSDHMGTIAGVGPTPGSSIDVSGPFVWFTDVGARRVSRAQRSLAKRR